MSLVDRIQRLFGRTGGRGEAPPKPPVVGPGVDIIIVSKEQVLAGDTSSVETGLEFAINVTKQTKDIPWRLDIGIDGYDEDPRELWQIPEVISWFARLNPIVAYWLNDLTLPVYIKTCAVCLSEPDVRDVFSKSPATRNVLPPYSTLHKELAVIMTIFGEGNLFCEELFGGDKKAAKRVIELAAARINRCVEQRGAVPRPLFLPQR